MRILVMMLFWLLMVVVDGHVNGHFYWVWDLFDHWNLDLLVDGVWFVDGIFDLIRHWLLDGVGDLLLNNVWLRMGHFHFDWVWFWHFHFVWFVDWDLDFVWDLLFNIDWVGFWYINVVWFWHFDFVWSVNCWKNCKKFLCYSKFPAESSFLSPYLALSPHKAPS
jgi:hypothetical protein